MTHIVIPTSDPLSTQGFDTVFSIDISDFTDASDYISLSLPAFQRTKIDLSKTFVDFTSNPDGDFGVGPTDAISFNQASPALPGSNGNTEMRIPISLLATIDKSSLTGVRFRIWATEECDFRCLSIRACAKDWEYSPIDLDTLYQRVHFPPSTNGAASQTFDLSEWPVVLRSNDLPGVSDPMPVNLRIGAAFSTGSLEHATGVESKVNQFALYFRDVPTDDQIQLELNSYTQASINAFGVQPDFGTALYTSRDQEDLDLQKQTELDEETQFMIERQADESTHTWLEVKLEWSAAEENVLTIKNADGLGYTFEEIPLDAIDPLKLDKGRYILIVDLQDDSIRVQIYHTDQVGNIETDPYVFDSGNIIDDNFIKRRRGRFGWWADFTDGDAYLDSVKTRGTNFGEVVSKEFKSITPVRGVSLYAGATNDYELVSGVEPTNPSATSITLDPTASATGEALRITTTPLKSLQGVASNKFLIDDPDNLRISFDLKFPSQEVVGGGLTTFLLGAYDQIIPIHLSAFNRDTWSHVKVSLQDTLFQTGLYQLVLMQTFPVVATTWWLENFSVQTSTVKWSARNKARDAWDPNEFQWREAGFTLNSLNGGIVFDELGDSLQVRGQVLRQNGQIHDFKAIPKYATLGRFAWSEEVAANATPTVGEIESNITSRTVAFTTASIDPSVVIYYWAFGDDSYGVGPVVTHTYDKAGTYAVIVTAKDDFGNYTTKQGSVTVS